MEIKEDYNCIVKAFENNEITIIKEDPNTYLFKASDIGKILELTNIRVSIQRSNRLRSLAETEQ